VSFAAVTLCVASQRVFIVVVVVVYFVILSIRKLLDTPSYTKIIVVFYFNVIVAIGDGSWCPSPFLEVSGMTIENEAFF
jgi:hypothetical protein